MAPRASALLGRHKKKLLVLGALILVPLLAHVTVALTTQIEPPAFAKVVGEPHVSEDDPDLRLLGAGYARHRGKILEVHLEGSPEAIGHQHGRLLYPEMVENEGTLYEQFEHFVPLAPLRSLMVDLSRVSYRAIDQGMSEAARREIASQAEAFSPDPFDTFLPTYHRFVFLQSLYDISLSFEHSPLLGCTSFALAGNAFEDGHTVLARNFDFEAGSTFDEGKAVFFVREDGRIPYVSVAWPGLVGAVTGMNAEGLALVVHGARAREPETKGEPVVLAMRDVLARAHNTAEALALLETKRPMVSHLVFFADASGDVAIAERAPGEPVTVRRPFAGMRDAARRAGLTNHFEGPLASDPANITIETVTSTRPRRLRLDEILANLPAHIGVEEAVSVLRDKRGYGNDTLALGHRRAIDALIATHGVVMDATARVLWVSEGPHLVGRFLRFDAGRMLEAGYVPSPNEPIQAVAADPIGSDGTYESWVERGSPHGAEQ